MGRARHQGDLLPAAIKTLISLAIALAKDSFNGLEVHRTDILSRESPILERGFFRGF
jgi:hypothetical protein